ncbi:MAG TPA: GNAT family N-acetyltransferase [Chitinophagaceae bacterium]|jgi:GNAT superfamily N-acetyltransferase|nr:GNAT family N-acetyltransferase [Chitinophagaceae bacterium]
MNFTVTKTTLDDIRDMRASFLQELNAQFVCDKCHYYGWSDDYVFMTDDIKIGYGCVWGTNKRQDRDCIFEFYLLPRYRIHDTACFEQLARTSGAVYAEVQTNDSNLAPLFFRYTNNIKAEAVLFEEDKETSLHVTGAIFREKIIADNIEDNDTKHVAEYNGEVAGSGGLMLNYNHPYADIYMDIKEPFRGKGLGGFLVQELKKEAYRLGRVPAARCNIDNSISRATLQKAGLRICGYRLKGTISL